MRERYRHSPSDNTIFITDDKTNSVLSSTNGKDFAPYATIPPVTGQPNALSQLIVTDDGSLLVAQFGFGKTGACSTSIRTGPPLRCKAPIQRGEDSAWSLSAGENYFQAGS